MVTLAVLLIFFVAKSKFVMAFCQRERRTYIRAKTIDNDLPFLAALVLRRKGFLVVQPIINEFDQCVDTAKTDRCFFIGELFNCFGITGASFSMYLPHMFLVVFTSSLTQSDGTQESASCVD